MNSLTTQYTEVLLLCQSALNAINLNGSRTKWYWTKWHGQNGTDKMAPIEYQLIKQSSFH